MKISFTLDFQLLMSKITNTNLSLKAMNSSSWQRFLKSGLVLFFLVSIALSAQAQKLAIYPDQLNVNLSGCDATATRSFTMENIGTDTLFYSCTAELYDDSKAGEQLAKYKDLSYGSISAVLIGDYLFFANYELNSIEKYNLKSQQMEEGFPVINEPISIAYDGKYLWVSQEGTSTVYCYDTTGNRIDKTITAPIKSFLITSDGHYLYLAKAFVPNPTIYKMDTTGTVIKSFSTSEVNNLSALTWAASHKGSELWAIDDNYTFKQFNLFKNTAAVARNFESYYFDGPIYGIVHNGSYFYALDWNGNLSLIHDGIYESALTLSSYNAAIPPGDVAEILVQIDASDVPSGDYTPEIKVFSNGFKYGIKSIGSDYSETIDLNLSIDGRPLISVSTANIDFGTIVKNTSKSSRFFIYNTGCDFLEIDTIIGSTAEFLLSDYSFSIPPFDSAEVIATFLPTSSVNYSTTLSIVNNDVVKSIALSGVAQESPAITTSIDTLSAMVSTCGIEETLESFTIGNTVPNTVLNYSISRQYSSTSSIYYTKSAETTNHIFSNVYASDFTLIITLNGDYTEYTEYATLEIEGTSFGKINTENIEDGEDYIRTYTFSGNKVREWLADNILEVNLINSIEVNPDIGEQLNQVRLVANGFPDYLSLSPTKGNVAGGNSTSISPSINTNGLPAGIHSGYFYVSSNDILTPLDSIYYSLSIDGESLLHIEKNSYNFGKTYRGTTSYDSIWVYNTGCDTLKVDTLILTDGVFSIHDTRFDVLPFDSAAIRIAYAPTSTGMLSASLTVHSNAPDTSISLIVTSFEPPVMEIGSDTLELNVGCELSTKASFSISNTGSDTLSYSIGKKNNILALTFGVDYFEEYENTLEALNLYFTDYKLVESTASTAPALQAALPGINTILIPEQEKATSAFFTEIASVLQKFVSNGGSVIFCGDDDGDLLNSGLLSGSFFYNETDNSTFIVNDYTHALTNGLSSTVTKQDGTYPLSLTNTDVTSLITYKSASVLAYRYLGSGKIIFMGYDFYEYDDNAARIIANAVKWTAPIVNRGSIISGSSASLDIDISTHSLALGSNTLSLFVHSNDPDNTYDSITCIINKQGTPSIELSTSSYSFGELITGTQVDETIWVYNTGCDTLIIDTITGTTAEFSVTNTRFKILPYDSTSFNLNFVPTSAADFTTDLILVNNDADITITVDGTGMPNPELAISIDTLSATINTCGGKTTLADFSIANTVANSTLNYFLQPSDTISAVYYTTTGETTNHIFNNIYTEEITLVITLNGDYTDSGSEYASLEIEGTSFGQINTENTNNGDDFIRTYTFSGNEVREWVTDGILEVNLINSPEVNTGYGKQLNQIRLVSKGLPYWLNFSSTEGTVDGNSSAIITPAINTEGLASGNYVGYIFVGSNDTLNKVDSIYYSLSLEGEPEIALSKESIDFPDINVNQYSLGMLTISNSGCDTLKITSITSDAGEFMPTVSSLQILPFESENISIYFYPATKGEFNGHLSILNNDVDITIPITGSASGTKVKTVTSNTVDGSYKAGDSIDITLRFNNRVYVDTTNGVPSIALNSGVNAQAKYVSGNLGYDLAFKYIIAADENSAALGYNSATAFALEGASIIGMDTSSVKTVLPNVGSFVANHAIVIDNLRPTVIISSTEANPTASEVFEVTFTFNEGVTLMKDMIDISNGTITDVYTSDDNIWIAVVEVEEVGDIVISLPEGAAFDYAENLSFASTPFTMAYEISGIGEVSLEERLVYPNPATSHIYVNLGAEMENATLEIINLSGAKLQHIEEYTSGNQIDVSNLSRGIYILRITTVNGTTAQQLIIE